MVRRALLGLAFLLLPLSAAIPAGPDAPVLTIIRHGAPPITRTLAALKSMPAMSVQLQDDSEAAAEFTCVSLQLLLAASDIEFGKAIRGERLTEYVVVSAVDGYRALFSIAEVDPAFRPKPILLCYAKDGSALPQKEGPLRLVVGDGNRHARWVRQVTTIEVGILP